MNLYRVKDASELLKQLFPVCGNVKSKSDYNSITVSLFLIQLSLNQPFAFFSVFNQDQRRM